MSKRGAIAEGKLRDLRTSVTEHDRPIFDKRVTELICALYKDFRDTMEERLRAIEPKRDRRISQ